MVARWQKLQFAIFPNRYTSSFFPGPASLRSFALMSATQSEPEDNEPLRGNDEQNSPSHGEGGSADDNQPNEQSASGIAEPAPDAGEPAKIIVPQLLRFGLLLEMGLLGLALIIDWVAQFSDPNQPLLEMLRTDWVRQSLIGSAAALPLLLLPLLAEFVPIGFFRHLQLVADQLLTPLFRSVPIWKYLLLSIAAGVGEEMLFRWCIQGGVTALFADSQTGLIVGILVASGLFGICHWISPTYALATFLVGLYLGWLMSYAGSVIAPIICHALYDFVALIYLGKIRQLPRVELQP